MIRHFTVSVFIVHQNQILLVKHKKHGKWLQPGGHLEENEVPSEAALREAVEETGLEVELLVQPPLDIVQPHAKTFVQPYLCLQESIPNRPEEPAHEHLDLIYIGRPIGSDTTPKGTEHCRWFTEPELEELKREDAIFPEVLDIFKHLQELLRNQFPQLCATLL